MTKLEFRNGQVVEMPALDANHSVTKVNLISRLVEFFSKRRCRVYDSDMKVKVEASGLNTFPDVSIVCGQPKFTSEKRNTLLNPGAIFEVLSDSTEAYDRGEKFWHYRHIPSLKTFVLVSTAQARVEVFELGEDNHWQLTTFDGFDATLRLKHYDLEIPLSGLYETTDIDPATPPEGDDG